MPAYRILEKLGQGGMGVVYLALQTSLDRKVALKLLTEDCRSNQQFFSRFLREVQASTRVSHKNIIKIIDYGEIDGQPYYAMEYLDAPTLEDAYKRAGQLAVPLAIKVCEQLLAALSCMHRAGLVHRDLKPSNVMLDDAGHVTLMDFGLVKDLERTQMTAQGKIVGTPGYLSPEVILGKDVDGRADLFSLGILVWEILVGDRPFGGDSLQSLLIGIVRGPHASVIERRADCPEYLSKFVDQLLAKNPEERFPSAAAALKALRIAQGKRVEPEQTDESIDRILDFSGEVELDGPVPQGTIEGGVSALAKLPERPVKPHEQVASMSMPASGLVAPGSDPGVAGVAPGTVPTTQMPRQRTGRTGKTPLVARTTKIIPVAPPPSKSPLAIAAAAGALLALVCVGGVVALRSRGAPAAVPSATVASAAPDPGAPE
jgi:serine/threonine protein kinase